MYITRNIVLSPFLLFLTNILSDVKSENDFPCFSNRLVNGTEFRYSSFKHFVRDTCSQCYAFVPRDFLKLTDYNDTRRNIVSKVPSLLYFTKDNSGILCRPRGTGLTPSPCLIADPEKMKIDDPDNDEILNTFSSKFHRETFLRCCNEAIKCCNQSLTSQEEADTPSTSFLQTDQLYCPAKWDGWDCFERVKAGTEVKHTCPMHALQSMKRTIPECLRGYSIKTCDINGNWHRYNVSGQLVEKTNYIYCSFVGRDKSLREIKLRVSLHSVTLVSLFIASSIFISYKQYRTTHIRLHLNFFISLALYSLSDMLFQLLIHKNHLEPNYNILNVNPGWCIFLTIFVKTSKLTNYCWMLCEALYLYKLIVYAFKEQTRIIHFYLVGWVLPVLTMIPYIAVHWALAEHNDKCWTESMGSLEWIHYPVPLFCLSANCILLGNILYVLFKKLRSSPAHFRTALRATLLLVPVFGIQYMFYITRGKITELCDDFSNFLFFLGIVIDCLQGTFVSTIFCFVNSEVHLMVRRTIRRRFNTLEVTTEEHNMSTLNGSRHHQQIFQSTPSTSPLLQFQNDAKQNRKRSESERDK